MITVSEEQTDRHTYPIVLHQNDQASKLHFSVHVSMS